MREKLLSLMKNENLTPSKLAELLGVQPSGISHILAGRNKPSFDLVQKILRRFPQINPDWLFLDQKPMYRQISASDAAPNVSPSASLFVGPLDPPATASEKPNSPASASEALDDRGNTDITTSVMQSVATRTHQKIRRIIILFDDHTFESFESPK